MAGFFLFWSSHALQKYNKGCCMNTLEFLKSILPEFGIHYLALFKEGYKFPAHKVYTDLETMAEAIEVEGVTLVINCNPNWCRGVSVGTITGLAITQNLSMIGQLV